MSRKRIHRYWIEIKDAKGSILFSTSAIWDGNERHLAIARIMRLDGVLEANISEPALRQYVGQDSDETVASSTVVSLAKKKPRL